MQKKTVFALLVISSLSGCSWQDRIKSLEGDNDKTKGTLQQLQTQNEALRTAIQTSFSANNILKEDIGKVEESLNELRREVKGIGLLQVLVPNNDRYNPVYGNHSGYNADVTVTNRGRGGNSSMVSIMARRTKKPSEKKANIDGTSEVENSANISLPIDYEMTLPLDMSAKGARRQVVVPCGYELMAQVAPYPVMLDIRIKYQSNHCE